MTKPDWLKPGLTGAVVGGALVAIVGFSWGGWVTGSGATEMAKTMAHDDVIAALVPVCVDMSSKDVDRATKLATIKEASSYKRSAVLMDSGWATVPGAQEPDRDLALACVSALDLGSS